MDEEKQPLLNEANNISPPQQQQKNNDSIFTFPILGIKSWKLFVGCMGIAAILVAVIYFLLQAEGPEEEKQKRTIMILSSIACSTGLFVLALVVHEIIDFFTS